MRSVALIATLSILVMANIASADPDVHVPMVHKRQVCRDCPFSMTLRCAATQQRFARSGTEPTSLRCAVLQKHQRNPIKGLHCYGGSDVPFPLRCSIER